MVFQKCCGFADLRIGCYCIAILHLLGGFLMLFMAFEAPALKWLFIFIGLVDILTGLGLGYGAMKNKQTPLAVYLVCSLTIIVIRLLLSGLEIFGLLEDYSGSSFGSGAAKMIGNVIAIYLWTCVYSFYKELKEGNVSDSGKN